jgi:hypothetical protein
MAFLAQYFRQELLDNVRADVDLVIRRIEAPEDGAEAPPPDPKRVRRAAAPAITTVSQTIPCSWPGFLLTTLFWTAAATSKCSR